MLIDKATVGSIKKASALRCIILIVLTIITTLILVGCSVKHEHTYSSQWSADESYHWHSDTCAHSTKSDKSLHSFGSWEIIKNATVSKSGLKKRVCTVCNYSEEEEIVKVIPTIYEITYNLVGGTFLTSVATTYTYGTGIDCLPTEKDLTREGYIFNGWKDSENNTVANISNTVIGDVALVAQWTPIEYTATFKADGEIIGTSKFTIEDSKLNNAPAIPEKVGYTSEWENYTLVADNISVNAVYNKISYNITYSNTKGVVQPNKTSYTIEDETFILSSLNKDGYIFEGWYDNDEKVESITKGSYGDRTLAAKWTPIEYTATFKVDGEIVGTARFTLEDSSITTPAIPRKTGYTSKWEDYTIGTDDITVNAIYSKISYRITYSNTKGVVQPNKTSYTIEDETFILSSLNKDGYIFEGWYDDDEKVESITKGSYGDRTLTAKWTLIEYTATFKADGEIVGTVKFTIEDSSVSAPTIPEKTGYTSKWENYSIVANDIIVNAVYTVNMFTIVWKNYDGQVLYVDSNVAYGTIPIYGGLIPIKNNDSLYNYVFNGWTPSMVEATANAEYVAQFVAQESNFYTIRYDANGGQQAPYSQTKAKGTNITLSTAIPINDMYVFVGWDCAYDGKMYRSGATFTLDANVTLYAIWGHTCESCNGVGKITTSWTCSTCQGTGCVRKCGSCGSTSIKHVIGSGFGYYQCNNCSSTYIVTSSTCSWCGGNGGGTNTFNCDICSGTGKIKETSTNHSITLVNANNVLEVVSVSYNAPYKLPVPNKHGYTFVGWYDSKEGGKKYTDGLGVCLGIWNTASIKTLYAQWILNKYTITYDCDENVDLIGLPTCYTVEDSNIILSIQNRDGYNFAWTINANHTTQIDTNMATDITVKGVWSPIEYVITYNLDGGLASNISEYTIETNSFTLKNPTKTGYTFIGWSNSDISSLQLSVTVERGTFGNLEYTANWRINQYTITFVTNGGNDIDPISLDYGADISMPVPSYYEKSFVGWFDETLLTEYNIVSMPAEDFTVYAKWVNYEIILTVEDITKLRDADDLYSAATYNASAIDTDGNEISIEISKIGGAFEVGKTVNVRIIAQGLYDVYALKTITGIKVYGKPTITYNDEIEHYNINSELTNASFGILAVDSFGEALNTTIALITDNVVGGKIVSVRVMCSDILDNEAELIIRNIRLYDNPTICYNKNINVKLTDVINGDLFDIIAKDSFEQILPYTFTILNGVHMAGHTMRVKVTTVDKHSNDSSLEFDVYVYGLPIISNATTFSIKEEGEIFVSNLGMVIRDSFNNDIEEYNITVSHGTRIAGESVELLILAKDNAGNVAYKNIYDVKVYGKPQILYDSDAIMQTTDPTIDGYCVTFNLNGGDGDNFVWVVKPNEPLKFPDIPVRSNSGNYVFTGWYEDLKCTKEYKFNQIIDHDFTLYAGWKKPQYGKIINIFLYSNSKNYYSHSVPYSPSGTSTQYVCFYCYESTELTMYFRGESGNQLCLYKDSWQLVDLSGRINSTFQSYTFNFEKGHCYYISLYNKNITTAYYYFEGAKLPNYSVSSISKYTGAYKYLSATAYDSFGKELDVYAELESGSLIGGQYVTYRLCATDEAGNTSIITTNRIKVLSNDIISLSYDASKSNVASIDSNGSEFDAVATNVFGEECVISIVSANGEILIPGKSYDIYIKAEDRLGNYVYSELMKDIKIYGTR